MKLEKRSEMTSLATLKSMNHGAKIGLEMEATDKFTSNVSYFKIYFFFFLPGLHYIASLT